MKTPVVMALAFAVGCAHVEPPTPKVVMMRCKVMPKPERPVMHFSKDGDRVWFPAAEAPALAAYNRGMEMWADDMIARCGEETAQ